MYIHRYEEWRINKLRRVKREYDPDNQFGFYAPIKPLLDFVKVIAILAPPPVLSTRSSQNPGDTLLILGV